MNERGPLAQALAEALGEDGLIALAAQYGGLRIRIHTRPRPETELAQRIGQATYARLQAAFSGEEIDVPRLAREASRRRLWRVHAMRAAGLTAGEIARSEGISLRAVRALIAKARHGQRPPEPVQAAAR